MGRPPVGEKQWLRRFGVHPKKRWGQNFLINPRVIARMLDRWSLEPGQRVLEIGSGAGSLTLPLLRQGLSVVAVEKDPLLCELLRERVEEECPRAELTIVNRDILELAPGERPLRIAPGVGWVLVGNLPYVITTAVLEWTIRNKHLFRWASFMVQREYGERVLARPATPPYGSLAVWVGFHLVVGKEIRVGAPNFWPVPKVDSLVMRLTPREKPPVAVPSEAAFEQVVRAAFSRRRKLIAGARAAGLDLARPVVDAALAAAGVDGRRRAEQCTREDFAAIARALAALDAASGIR
jgi:16S rRNA (adenine1518-N6/adenine1519-N6)-dimethyltransferase